MHKFIESIEKEYRNYKAEMLQKEPEHIWDKCCEIYFYNSFHEYFLYNEAISYVVANKLGECENIISGCWDVYLKNEELSKGRRQRTWKWINLWRKSGKSYGERLRE